MGEEKVDMVFFVNRKNVPVFWNMEDYPIPAGADIPCIRRNIDDALDLMGFHGVKIIMGFTEQLNCDRRLLWNAGIEYYEHPFVCTPERSYDSAAFQIPLDMIIYATSTPEVPLVVISKQSPKSELHRVLNCLKSRNRVLLLVEPPDQEHLFHSVDSVLHYAQLLGGGKPISKPPDYLDSGNGEKDLSKMKDLSIIEHPSKILDFSEPIKPVRGAYAAVFWDIHDCPFPLCSNPDQVYRKIEAALRLRGCRDNVSIWVYVDEENESWGGEFLRNKTWESSIYFLPGGDDKVSRRNRMLNDIFLWVMDSPVEPDLASLIVVSDQVGRDTFFFGMLGILDARSYYVILVTPSQGINEPESSDWPGLLIDGGYFFCSDNEMEPEE